VRRSYDYNFVTAIFQGCLIKKLTKGIGEEMLQWLPPEVPQTPAVHPFLSS
jgi:hypothetical protein